MRVEPLGVTVSRHGAKASQPLKPGHSLTGSEMPDSARSATNEIPRGKYTGRWQQRGTVLLSIIAVFFGMDDVLAILFL